MQTDFRIDEDALAEHVRFVTIPHGVRGVLANGHAGENFLLNMEEKRRVLEVTRAAMPDGCLLVAGVNQESSLAAAEEAHIAEISGADAVMVFAPSSWAAAKDVETVLRHHLSVREATNLPMMLFQGSIFAAETAFSHDVLARLVKIPGVVGIKEGSWETAAYEANRRLIQQTAPHVAVMASGDEHLLPCYVLGSEGSLVSLAVVIPETIVALDKAVRAGDLAEARRLHEVVYPLAKAIYGTPPACHATARLKTCLRLLGRLKCDSVRPPIGALSSAEESRLISALILAGLLEQ